MRSTGSVGHERFVARHLLDVCRHLGGEPLPEPADESIESEHYPDLKDVDEQHQVRQSLQVVTGAGAHNLLMSGPPETGKTMLATRLPGILPEFDESQAN